MAWKSTCLGGFLQRDRRAAILTAALSFAVVSPAGAGPSPSPEIAPPTGIAGEIVAHFHMQRVPEEGPWFSLTYTSDDAIDGAALPKRYSGRTHAAGSAILLLETPVDFSAMHRLKTDEMWHFYGGAPVDLLLLYPDGHGRRIRLGSHVLAGELPQFNVPHGVWQGSAPRGQSVGTYSLAGDQLSPGFDYADFEMGYRDELQREFPAFAPDIERLTRIEYSSRKAALHP